MRVLALTRYGAEAASTRQRLLQYLPHLSAAGIDVDWHAMLDDDYVRSLARGTRPARTAIAAGYARRLAHLAGARRYDLLWVYAELFPYLPAAFERLAFRSGIPVVYDFDDAFFERYDGHPNPAIRRFLAGKLEPLIAGAAACSCGNAYLRDFAARLNDRAVILPTVVDTDAYRPVPGRRAAPLTIGWIGTPSTWTYVRPMLPRLSRLAAEHGARLRVVGAGPVAAAEAEPVLDAIEWTEATEIAEVQRFDIGIMPLPDDRWARGKSGYKLVQYMACGLPVVASPVGVNTDIVVEGETGFLADDAAEWERALGALLADADLRRRMGAAGRARAEARYSLRSCAPITVELFRSAAERRRR